MKPVLFCGGIKIEFIVVYNRGVQFYCFNTFIINKLIGNVITEQLLTINDIMELPECPRNEHIKKFKICMRQIYNKIYRRDIRNYRNLEKLNEQYRLIQFPNT